jgi:hypothetical protein
MVENDQNRSEVYRHSRVLKRFIRDKQKFTNGDRPITSNVFVYNSFKKGLCAQQLHLSLMCIGITN